METRDEMGRDRGYLNRKIFQNYEEYRMQVHDHQHYIHDYIDQIQKEHLFIMFIK